LRGLEELEPFDAELGGIGHFDNRVLWLGTKKGTEELRFLAKRIGERIRVPNLDFHAHVTLARNKGCAPDAFSAVVEKLRQADFARRIRVRGFDCMQSTLTKNAPLYRTLFSVAFVEDPTE
jgi:2'-5' RNA ligase